MPGAFFEYLELIRKQKSLSSWSLQDDDGTEDGSCPLGS